MNLIATKHAYKRAKKRLGWNKSALNNMMPRIYQLGKKHGEAKSRKLRKFFDKVFLKYPECNNTRIYKGFVYFFANNVLITVYPLDKKLNGYP